MITKEGNESLTALHRSAFKQVSSNTIPLFEKKTGKNNLLRQKYFPFVKIQRDGKDLFINKTNVVWLLQESRKMKEFLLTASYK